MDRFLKTQQLGEDSIVRMCGLVNHLSKNVKVVFDIGAATGEYTRYFTQQFRKATIFAFEPYEPSYEKLLIRTLGTKTKPYPIAISNENKFAVDLWFNPNVPDSSSLVCETYGLSAMKTPTMPLDVFCYAHKVKHIDFMKIDAEGAEPLILEGGKETLKRTDNIFIEISYLKRGIPYMISILEQLKDFKLMYISEDSNFFFTRLPWL